MGKNKYKRNFNIKSVFDPISHGFWNDVVPWGWHYGPLVFLALWLPKAKDMLSDKYFGL